jgi:polyribonucleotide nucleotidyltransferase
MRPLFPESWRNETQIVAMVLSADSDNDPDVIAVTAASAASYCSDLPFEKRIACVRVGLLDGQLVANPTVAEQKKSLLNIVIAGTEEAKIVMVESGALGSLRKKPSSMPPNSAMRRSRRLSPPLRSYTRSSAGQGCRPATPVRPGDLQRPGEKVWREASRCLNTEKHPKKELSPR